MELITRLDAIIVLISIGVIALILNLFRESKRK